MEPTLTPERFDAPLYEGVPFDLTPEARDFTVTVAGPERHDGERPYTYVVSAYSTEEAWSKALAWHIATNQDIDAYVVASESHEGLPPTDPGYHWSDLRPEQAKAEAVGELITKTVDFNRRYDEAVAPFRTPDGEDIDPEQFQRYDETRADYGEEAVDLVASLAKLAGEAS